MTKHDPIPLKADKTNALGGPYCIALSGPPRSGKDTVGKALAQILTERHKVHVKVLAISNPLRRTIYTMMGVPYTHDHYEANKDIPQAVFAGRTIRQAMIRLAEDHVRPDYGVAFYAQTLVREIGIFTPDVVIVTDIGFDAEVDVFEEFFGQTNCLWPQLQREGCDFTGDSRTYVGRPERCTPVVNNGFDFAGAEESAGRIYGRMLNQFHWELPPRG